jgi:hypothetical protein
MSKADALLHAIDDMAAGRSPLAEGGGQHVA